MFTPSQCPPLPDYFTGGPINEIADWKHRWDVSYIHHFEEKGVFLPSTIQSSDENRIYYLSPYKIVIYIKHLQKGVPYCDSFNLASLWTLTETHDNPTGRLDDSVSVRVQFRMGAVFHKSVLVKSLIEKECQASCLKVFQTLV